MSRVAAAARIHRHDLAGDVRGATLVGVLGRADAPWLREVLDALLEPDHPVLLDVSRLAVAHPPVLAVLPAALLAGGGWPAARLVLVGADPRFRAALRRSGAVRDVLVADDVREARSLLRTRPDRVRGRLHLRSARSGAGRAPAFVRDLVTAWEVPRFAGDAQRAAAVLVADGSRRASGPCALTVALDAEGLWLGLRVRRSASEPDGRRLAGLTRSWGVVPRTDGDLVWVSLPMDPLSTARQAGRRPAGSCRGRSS